MNEANNIPWWSPWGTIGRAPYLFIGLALFGVKFNVDRIIAFRFGNVWKLYQYWLPDPIFGSVTAPDNRGFVVSLLAAAVPFIAVGLFLTLKRLRSAGLPLWLVILFFVPFVNLLLFALLSIVPQRNTNAASPQQQSPWWPRSDRGAMAAGVIAAVAPAVLAALAASNEVANYGFPLFVGTPFIAGFASGVALNCHRDQGRAKTFSVALSALFISGLIMVALLLEGIICLVMTLPIAIPLTLLGAAVGRGVSKPSVEWFPSGPVAGMLLLLTPSLGWIEKAAHLPPERFSVRSEVIVNAAPEIVWQHVIRFAELPRPTETIFKTGIAYPIRAEITGTGAGAVRKCVFSTGAFVEPITAWEEPRRLAFDVQEQPPVMQELSWSDNLVPAHVSNQYLRSTRGEFLLEPLPGGRTRLIGTTWYDLRFWPSTYWALWSDAIIHRIHMRVLNHVKTLSEAR